MIHYLHCWAPEVLKAGGFRIRHGAKMREESRDRRGESGGGDNSERARG